MKIDINIFIRNELKKITFDLIKRNNNEEILAFILTNGEITEEEVKKWLKKHLVSYKIPQQIYIVKKFPTAATGKILKNQLTTLEFQVLKILLQRNLRQQLKPLSKQIFQVF